jgi:hypothetical protein
VIHGRVVYDDDGGMYVRPTQEPRGAGTRPFNPLVTDDIEGARAGKESEVTVGGIPMDRRRFWGVTNMVADVPGSQVGSKAPGLTTVRMTDPNERDYVLLDGRRWNAEELAVGKSWYNAATTILAAEAADQAATMSFGRTGIAAAVAPAHNYAKKILDPRDAELARMRGEVETLRREREVLQLSQKLALSQRAGGGGGIGGGSGGAAARAAAAAAAATAALDRGRGEAGAGASAGSEREAARHGHAAHDAEAAPVAARPPRSANVFASTIGGGGGIGGGDGGGHGGGEGGGVSGAAARPPLAAAAPSGSAPHSRGGHEGVASSAAAAAHAAAAIAAATAVAPRGGSGGSAGGAGGGSGGGKAAAHAGTYVEHDPVATLRSALAAANARNILGVIPATRPQQDLTGRQATLREASGRYDAKLDAYPAAPRGVSPFAVRGGSHMVGGVFHDQTARREHAMARAKDVSDVRGLPS